MLGGIAAALAVGTVVAIALRLIRSDARRTRRVLRRTRVTRIADLVDGQLACVVGTVEIDGEPVLAMVTKMPCVAYDTTVAFTSSTGAFLERTEVERRLVPFFIVDDSGRARVDAPEAALCNPPIARGDRYEERVVQNGDRVRLVGSAVLEPVMTKTPEHGFREGRTKATITGSRRFPLLIDVERS